jgi:hypothetical protein
MSPLQRLQHSLSAPRSRASHANSMAPLDHEIEVLRRTHESGGEGRPPRDVLVEAVQRFRVTPVLHNSREARLVSFGCTEPIGGSSYRLIEDGDRFGQLLDGVERGFRAYRPQFRRSYKGLLEAYLQYYPVSAIPNGLSNWNKLRNWLNLYARDVNEPEGINQLWVSALQSNAQLFSEDPAQAYGRDYLEGRESDVNNFRRDLEIKTGSWFTQQLVRAQIKAAVSETQDAQFKRHIPKVLELLKSLVESRGTLFNEGLGAILTRFEQCRPQGVDESLRDFTLAQWGNPQILGGEKSGWRSVSSPVRNMVSAWLNKHYIEYFFGVLAQEGRSDQRRLKFWVRYHRSIGLVNFALGPQARESYAPDMRAARTKLKALIVDLQGGGDGGNNAFVMSFGDWVVVEFGQTGNACFLFKQNDMPFVLGQNVSAPEVRAHDRTRSRGASGSERMTHGQTKEGTWEQRFERELGSRGIYPDQGYSSGNAFAGVGVSGTQRYVPPTPRPTVAPTSVSPTSVSPTPKPLPTKLDASQERLLRAECERHRFALRDLRPSNGNLWVEIDDSDNFGLSERLVAWGFRYKAGKGWWLSSETR